MSNNAQNTRILYLITKSNWGGAQRYVFDLATTLSKESFDITVGLGGRGQLKTRLEQENIPVVTISTLERDVKLISDISAFIEVYKIIKATKPDIVHLNSSKIGGIGALAARLAGVKRIVFTAHGWAFNEERGILSKKIIAFFHWLTLMLCHTTVTVSAAMKKQIHHWPFVQHKIVTIHNGVAPIVFLQREQARASLAPALDRPRTTASLDNNIVIGTIGELHKTKGQVYALLAISQLVKKYSILFVIIGEGEERKAIEEKIAELGLSQNVVLAGHKVNAATYLKAFDIFILPSLSEGLAYVALEAGLASLPIIASRTGGLVEVIEDNKTGLLVPPKDVSALANAIELLIKDKGKSEQLSSALHSTITTKFSLKSMVQKTSEIYKA